MKRLSQLILVLTAAMMLFSCSGKYETVKGDPMNTKIYTMDNGMKIYMTVNKDEPRLQTMIAVRTGGKNDPSDNTGLAHYLEHLMFKGTESFGTSDYAAEKPLLDKIEELYEVYRTKTDPMERRMLYHQIDSVSYLASQIAIPNEYDKLMAMIGSQGTNAFTSEDVTCYVEDIPSNQIDNWAKVQADRFKNMVIRGFHTELEAVYEEYNMNLNEDMEKALDAISKELFKNHPYGQQTVIGTQDHLKNPSITTIKKQKATYYVPDNIAICVSGDFDPDEFVKTIEKYFGDWQRSAGVPELKYAPEKEITAPVEKDVYGTEAEFVMVGWSYPGSKDLEGDAADVVSAILYNGMAGLIDLDINQQQKVLEAAAFPYGSVDYGRFLLEGYPKEGQSLKEVRDLLLAEVAKLRNGDFDEDLVEASIANFKLSQMSSLENNRSRAMQFVNSFIAGRDWKDDVHMLDRLSKLTKQDIVDWANKYLGENSHVTVYKHIGVDPDIHKIEAPAITPIATNRDKQSAFLAEVQNTAVKPIEPVFVDFSKDMSVFKGRSDLDIIYKNNEKNDIAQLVFLFDEGLLNDPAMSFALNYVSYLGTETRSAEQIAMEMYKLASNFNFACGDDQTQITVTGLGENIGKALEIAEDLIANAVGDENILAAMKADQFQQRAINKFNQSSCSSALNRYVIYGPENVKARTLTNQQIVDLTSEELLAKVTNLLTKQHKVLYYGPATSGEVKNLIAESHDVAADLEPLQKIRTPKVRTDSPKVFVAPYDARQFNYIQFTNRGEKYNMADEPAITLYNEYFGSGMNTIVFQEMREARALAYSAGARLASPTYKDDDYYFMARIGSQNDKLRAAVEAFDEIINNMPQSDRAFEIAKTALDGVLRTSRTTGAAVLNAYLAAQELGIDEPVDKLVYEKLPSMTMNDIVAIQQKYVKDRTYYYGILGDPKDLDMNYLKTLGPVQNVSLEDIFGY